VANKKFAKSWDTVTVWTMWTVFWRRPPRSMTELVQPERRNPEKLEVLADKLTEYREDEESLRTALLGAQKRATAYP
jgi:cell division initiation protein